MSTVERRERQARRLLSVCLRPMLSGCLEKYVEAYEAGTLECGSFEMCALGRMGTAAGVVQGHDDTSYPSYFAMKRGPHARESRHIEAIFEGAARFKIDWIKGRVRLPHLRYHQSKWSDEDRLRRQRWIYEACLEELASRRSERLAKPVAWFVAAGAFTIFGAALFNEGVSQSTIGAAAAGAAVFVLSPFYWYAGLTGWPL